MAFFILTDQSRFPKLCLTSKSGTDGGAPVAGDTIFAYKLLENSPFYPAFQEWVFEEAADLPGLYTIANKYTVSSDSVTPLYITAEPNPTSRTAVHLSPKISDPTGQFSLRQLWRFVPVIGRKNSSYVQNYQSSGYVFDIENFDTTHPITLIPPIDSAAQRYAVDPTFGPTSSIQASIEQLETED